MVGNENDKDNEKVIMVSRSFQCQSISHRSMSMIPQNQQVISRGDSSGQGFICFSSAAEYQFNSSSTTPTSIQSSSESEVSPFIRFHW